MSDTYYPQDGDYVEATATVRGRVRRLDPSAFAIDYTMPDGTPSSWSWEDEEVRIGDWKFTKVAQPLPTTPGSVIRYAVSPGDNIRILLENGYWQSPFSGIWPPASVERAAFEAGYEVIFDAGQSA